MIEQVLIAGFGGQGIMSTGQLLAYAGMMEGKHVAWIPSYGPEMRGGTANCGVTVSDTEISSPLVTEPTALIVMNHPSLEKFEKTVLPGGIILTNSSLVHRVSRRSDLGFLAVPANEIAEELGNVRIAANVVLGVFIGYSGAVNTEAAVAALEKVLPARRHKLIPMNKAALERGAALGLAYRREKAAYG
ncbi:MAG: 2-oxoacid:ferredoxin oxidoreductase subunit gamma [Desulforudis sp.]|nr:MAG: 2-oxoacid:ferredoxin oxidoreductase subunit gamma [Desulforudis sp.]